MHVSQSQDEVRNVTTVLHNLDARASRSHAETVTALRDAALSDSARRIRHSMALLATQSSTLTSPAEPHLHLRCPPGCQCRCHICVMAAIIPRLLAPFIGQVNVSKRILHAFGILSWDCNMQTCRRDLMAPNAIKWYLPEWWPYFDLLIQSSRLPFYFAIQAPRLVPMNARIWGIIGRSDIDGLHALFEAREASVYDVNDNGTTLLYVSYITRSQTYAQIVVVAIDCMPGVERLRV